MTDSITAVPTSPAIDGLVAQSKPVDAREAQPAFQRLLESLERLSKPAKAPEPVEDTDSLKRALADAETGFQQVMDLRRHLEEAFHQRIV